MDATTVAVDLAKDVFEVALANRVHRIIDRKRLTRRQFESFVEGLSAGTKVVMEACGTAHYWGRRCQARGLAVRLLPVQYVRPYVGATRRTAPTPKRCSKRIAVPACNRCRSRPLTSRRCKGCIGCAPSGRPRAPGRASP